MGRIAYRAVCALFACVLALGAYAPRLHAAETTQYTYDALGRVVSAIDASGKKVAYTYDSAGNRTRVSNGAEFTEILPTAWSASSNGGTTGLATTNGMRDGGFFALNTIHVTNVEIGAWVKADLGSVQNVNHIAVAAAIESTTGVSLADLNDTAVEYSVDGTIWNTAATIEGVSPGATKAISLGGVALRYLRIHRLASGRVGLGDLQLYSAAAANTPLVANPDSITSTGSAVTFDPRTNDVDNDGFAIAISGADSPPHGTVTVNAGVSLTYTPNAGYFGADSFLYTVTDGHNGTASAMVTAMVRSSTNHPPVAVPDQFNISDRATAAVDGINDLRPLANDYDPDGDVLTITGTTAPMHGTVSVIGSSLARYQPTVGYSGSDTFNYTISDGRGGTATAAITVSSGNTNPVAVQDNVSTAQGQAVTLDPRLNDSDPNGDPISVTAITQPTNGAALLNGDQTVTYTPSIGFVGGDTVNYTLSDGRGGTATGLIAITVMPPPPPNAVSDSIAATGGVPLTFDPRSNDSDPQNRPLTIVALTAPSHGTAVIGSSGTEVTYTATSGYSGVDSFTYTIANDQGVMATATVSVNALSVEYLVVAGGGGGWWGGGGGGGVLQGVTPLAVSSLTVAVGPGGDPGGNGGSSSIGASLVAIGGGGGGMGTTPIDAKTGGSGGGQSYRTTGPGASGTSGQGNKGGDGIGFPDSGGGGGAGGPGTGGVLSSSDRSGDGGPGITSNISGSPVSYAAGGGGGGITDEVAHSSNVGSPGGSSAGAPGTTSPANRGGGGGGGFSDNATGTGVEGAGGGSGVVIVRYRGSPKATGGTISQIGGYTIHTFTTGGTFAVTSTNGPPVAVNDNVALLQNTTLIFDPRTNDTDPNGDALYVIAVGPATHGIATVLNSGQISYQPTAGYTGTDTFSYTISDGEGLTSTATVTATVQTTGVFEYLVVAGGGGGGTAGNGGGGGGGGGGVVYGERALTSGLSLSITIGGGGATETNGANSALGALAVAVGGGNGARGNGPWWSGNGGSGGGGGGDAAGYGVGTVGQGSNGAPGNSGGGGGGGGGGATGPGVPGPAGGNGGPGFPSSLSGTATTYGSGGHGGAPGSGVAGAANSGNGGGGWPSSGTGAAGGSGIVIIRYPGSQVATGGTVTTSGGYTIHTFTTGGTFTVP